MIIHDFRLFKGFRSAAPWVVTRFSIVAVLLVCALSPVSAWAAIEGEAQFVFNTFGFLVWGALVMWMAAGFTMLEAGSVRTKNASVICLKNIGLYSIAGLAYYLVGFNIMYVDVEPGGWFGSLEFLYGTTADEVVLLGGEETAAAAVVQGLRRFHRGPLNRGLGSTRGDHHGWAALGQVPG